MNILKCAAVLAAAMLLGRWFDMERNKLVTKGHPWYKAWKTLPGLLIIIILCSLLAVSIFFD